MTTDASKPYSMPKMKPSVTILVGMVGSGKSAVAAQTAAANPNAIIVSDDEIVTMLHGDYTLYNPQKRSLYKSIEQHVAATALAQGCDVIVDRTNLTVAQRARFISLAQTFGAGEIAALVMPYHPHEALLDARMQDPRGYSREHWSDVMLKHHQSIERVRIEEGFTDIIDHSGGRLTA